VLHTRKCLCLSRRTQEYMPFAETFVNLLAT
jgi:hypothetical protein